MRAAPLGLFAEMCPIVKMDNGDWVGYSPRNGAALLQQVRT